MTGFLAKKLGIQHQELNRYWTMNSSALMDTKMQQSPDLFHKDYVAGPTGRFHATSTSNIMLNWRHSFGFCIICSPCQLFLCHIPSRSKITWQGLYIKLFKESSIVQDVAQESPLVLPEQVQEQHLWRGPEKLLTAKSENCQKVALYYFIYSVNRMQMMWEKSLHNAPSILWANASLRHALVSYS